MKYSPFCEDRRRGFYASRLVGKSTSADAFGSQRLFCLRDRIPGLFALDEIFIGDNKKKGNTPDALFAFMMLSRFLNCYRENLLSPPKKYFVSCHENSPTSTTNNEITGIC